MTPEIQTIVQSAGGILAGFLVNALINILKLNPAVKGGLTTTLNGTLNVIISGVTTAIITHGKLDTGALLGALWSAIVGFTTAMGTAQGQEHSASSALKKAGVIPDVPRGKPDER